MRTIAVIGNSFGDKGKGFTCSRLASSLKNALIIKHNGGGQAGHTVEDPKGKWRFIHHQIGAGAEYHVPTLFADSFMPDLFQLGKEVKEFTELFGFQPILYSEKNARVTTVDDVLLNTGSGVARGMCPTKCRRLRNYRGRACWMEQARFIRPFKADSKRIYGKKSKNLGNISLESIL